MFFLIDFSVFYCTIVFIWILFFKKYLNLRAKLKEIFKKFKSDIWHWNPPFIFFNQINFFFFEKWKDVRNMIFMINLNFSDDFLSAYYLWPMFKRLSLTEFTTVWISAEFLDDKNKKMITEQKK